MWPWVTDLWVLAKIKNFAISEREIVLQEIVYHILPFGRDFKIFSVEFGDFNTLKSKCKFFFCYFVSLTLGMKNGSAENTNNHSSRKWYNRDSMSSPSANTTSVPDGVTLSISVMYPNMATAALRERGKVYIEGLATSFFLPVQMLQATCPPLYAS